MPRTATRQDRDAGGPADLLAAKAALRQEVWSAMRAAKVARFPGAAGRIPNFTGAEAAAERLRGLPAWQAAGTIPVTGHDVPVDLIITPERVIDCRRRHGPRPAAGLAWDDPAEEEIRAIPLLSALRERQR